ncbi:uncharacterized protein LOC106706376 [Latimeria chalumnae]|uniref:uncharacterized protein LOC106706376 n=1 Tax=Latimeria chalumnae TaxID=7897 RepID=UPI0006D92FBA|nr:PREDICTED: uncharacterized protein LOC106706376 [Latimeria chalumnae]|eukprot:XP_014352729.1 PREDICTED: uncharacterized protein LOC106706376 [Latimeria chalumnae]
MAAIGKWQFPLAAFLIGWNAPSKRLFTVTYKTEGKQRNPKMKVYTVLALLVALACVSLALEENEELSFESSADFPADAIDEILNGQQGVDLEDSINDKLSAYHTLMLRRPRCIICVKCCRRHGCFRFCRRR